MAQINADGGAERSVWGSQRRVPGRPGLHAIGPYRKNARAQMEYK
jgi:hypothetical protein